VSATLTRPIKDAKAARRLSSTLFPKETTRTTTPSQLRLGPSPKVPRLKRLRLATGPAQTSLMFCPAPLRCRDEVTVHDHRGLVKRGRHRTRRQALSPGKITRLASWPDQTDLPKRVHSTIAGDRVSAPLRLWSRMAWGMFALWIDPPRATRITVPTSCCFTMETCTEPLSHAMVPHRAQRSRGAARLLLMRSVYSVPRGLSRAPPTKHLPPDGWQARSMTSSSSCSTWSKCASAWLPQPVDSC
jgi:hypothetical protein